MPLVNPINDIQKRLAFEYALSQFLSWHSEASPNPSNDLSKLKSMKLLFFLATADAYLGSDPILLQEVFNNFHALPLGHVESYIYNYIKQRNGQLDYFNINDQGTSQIEGTNLENLKVALDNQVSELIDANMRVLKEKNFQLISYSAYELVEISHRWTSWKVPIQQAKLRGDKGGSIPLTLLLNEQKYYFLRNF